METLQIATPESTPLSVKIKLGGLWRNRTRNGKEYLSGNLTHDSMLQIWPNNHKREGKSDPDYNLYIMPRWKKPETTTEVDPFADTAQIPF
jgi:hypothetical protein